MKPALKSLIFAALVEGASVAALALGGFGPCGPSNPLGLLALLINIFPGALVIYGLQKIFATRELNDATLTLLAGAVQLGFFWWLIYMWLQKRHRAMRATDAGQG